MSLYPVVNGTNLMWKQEPPAPLTISTTGNVTGGNNPGEAQFFPDTCGGGSWVVGDTCGAVAHANQPSVVSNISLTLNESNEYVQSGAQDAWWWGVNKGTLRCRDGTDAIQMQRPPCNYVVYDGTGVNPCNDDDIIVATHDACSGYASHVIAVTKLDNDVTVTLSLDNEFVVTTTQDWVWSVNHGTLRCADGSDATIGISPCNYVHYDGTGAECDESNIVVTATGYPCGNKTGSYTVEVTPTPAITITGPLQWTGNVVDYTVNNAIGDITFVVPQSDVCGKQTLTVTDSCNRSASMDVVSGTHNSWEVVVSIAYNSNGTGDIHAKELVQAVGTELRACGEWYFPYFSEDMYKAGGQVNCGGEFNPNQYPTQEYFLHNGGTEHVWAYTLYKAVC